MLRFRSRSWRLCLGLVAAIGLLWLFQPILAMSSTPEVSLSVSPSVSLPELLTDPFLQRPTEKSVQVVWFTAFAGSQHSVRYGADLGQTVMANTTPLSRTYEDAESQWTPPVPHPTRRLIWRHEATVTGLTPGQRLPYQVSSVREDGARVQSGVYTLAAKPLPGSSLKILLTSDHQLKPMAAANLQKVVETVGSVDAVLFAGDLVNVADRASEWFDCCSGSAFFPVLQGRASYELEKNGHKTRYRGGAVIQSAPLYAAIGNHEVMGRFRPEHSLDQQFGDAIPRSVAAQQYDQQAQTINPTQDPAVRAAWIKNHSFNTDTYEEIFTLPESGPGGKRYYAETFGDVGLIVLYVTNIWRVPGLDDNARGKYRERSQDFNQPDRWGYGQHIFESIAPGSTQYEWLQQELHNPAFEQAKYKIVMFHHPPHSLGENSVPAYTDPVQVIDRDAQGQIMGIRYEYPREADYIVRDLVPLLERAGVQLVFYGHSHLWNRFVSPSGLHFLETSNVGNSYGAYVGKLKRRVPVTPPAMYAASGDPNGYEPVMPTIAPLLDDQGNPMPYIASNDITAFSIFDTATGLISSYRFDTRQPDSPVVKFDQFALRQSSLPSGDFRH